MKVKLLQICLLFLLGLFPMSSYSQEEIHPKNIILVVVDGVGFNHLSATSILTSNKLGVSRMAVSGMMKVPLINGELPDPVNCVSMIATGNDKLYAGGIGMNASKEKTPTLLELAQKNEKAIGIISTSSLTYSSPAAFFAHQLNYKKEENIALDLFDLQPDVFIGGGMKYFKSRNDGRDLVTELRKLGYKIIDDNKGLEKGNSKTVAGLITNEHIDKANSRNNYLSLAWHKAFRTLVKNEKGYFLVVTHPHPDWAARADDLDYLAKEMVDFDLFISKIMDYVGVDKETLLIIASSFESGALSLNSSGIDWKDANVKLNSIKTCTNLVPVFANGPGSQNFTGIYGSADLFRKISELIY